MIQTDYPMIQSNSPLYTTKSYVMCFRCCCLTNLARNKNNIILTICLENFMYRTSRPAVLTSLKSLQGTCPTVMLMFGQRCHDVRTTCITKLICVLGNVVYVTWRIIFVNTSGHGDQWVVGAHQGVMGSPN